MLHGDSKNKEKELVDFAKSKATNYNGGF